MWRLGRRFPFKLTHLRAADTFRFRPGRRPTVGPLPMGWERSKVSKAGRVDSSHLHLPEYSPRSSSLDVLFPEVVIRFTILTLILCFFVGSATSAVHSRKVVHTAGRNSRESFPGQG